MVNEPEGPTRPRLRDQEPLATIRAYPRRFGWGIPAVFAVSIGAGLPFAQTNLSLAIAIQLFLQTGGLLWLYIPAFRRRVEALRRMHEEEGGREEASRNPGGEP